MLVDPLKITNLYQLLGALIMIVPGLFAAYWAYKSNSQGQANNGKIVETQGQVAAAHETLKDVDHSINGRLSDLVTAAFREGHAKGILEGAAAEKARADAIIAGAVVAAVHAELPKKE